MTDTPQSLWDEADLPEEAFERLADGGPWRLAPNPEPIEARGPTAVSNRTVTPAIYHAEREDDRHWFVYGKWEDENDAAWRRVGHMVD